MAFDAFLKFDGIEGESTDDKHKNEIEILSYEWGLTSSSSAGAGGGAAGKPQFQGFHFVSRLQQSSPTLFLRCASGAHIKTALLTIRKSGSGSSVEFLKVTFSDVVVSSFEELGTPDEPDLKPNNKLGLSFGKILVEYTGGKAGSIRAGWDVIGNKAL